MSSRQDVALMHSLADDAARLLDENVRLRASLSDAEGKASYWRGECIRLAGQLQEAAAWCSRILAEKRLHAGAGVVARVDQPAPTLGLPGDDDAERAA